MPIGGVESARVCAYSLLCRLVLTPQCLHTIADLFLQDVPIGLTGWPHNYGPTNVGAMLRTALIAFRLHTQHRDTCPSIHLILLCLLCEQQPGALPLHGEGGHHQPLVPVVHQLRLRLTSLQAGIREFLVKY